AHLGPLVPVEAQPAQAVENGCEGLLGGALGVGVLNAEDEGAAVVAGKEPVEERRASPTHVQVAGGTGRKTGPNLCQARSSPQTRWRPHEVPCRARTGYGAATAGGHGPPREAQAQPRAGRRPMTVSSRRWSRSEARFITS